jgi:hypothetical protein
VTPRPDLLFAIAADDPSAVRSVLEGGTASVNEAVGPAGEGALGFAMGNKSLRRRVEIVKTLLAFGADVRKAKEGMAIKGKDKEDDSGTQKAMVTKETAGGDATSPERKEEMDPVTR